MIHARRRRDDRDLPDLQQFVHDEWASGHFKSERELVLEAVRMLRDSRLQFERFQAGLRERLDSLDRGEGIVIEGDEALEKFFDEIEAEADRQGGEDADDVR